MVNLRLLLAHFRLYLYNEFLNRIPINFIRLFFVRRYITVGKNTFIGVKVKILNLQPNKKQIIVGDNCVINPDVLLDGRIGRIIIKNNVDISRDTYIYTAQHDPHSDTHAVVAGDVTIEDYVWIASRVTILPNVTLYRGCVIACASVVTKDVESKVIAGGVPAKKIGVRKSNLTYNLSYSPPFYT